MSKRGGFQGGMPMGGMNMNMVKQIQKMQKDMEKIQEELGSKEVETSVGGGAIKVVANGKKEILSIKIKPEAVDPEDTEMLEDLIMSAVNEALRSAEEMMASGMSKVAGGMKGLF